MYFSCTVDINHLFLIQKHCEQRSLWNRSRGCDPIIQCSRWSIWSGLGEPIGCKSAKNMRQLIQYWDHLIKTIDFWNQYLPKSGFSMRHMSFKTTWFRIKNSAGPGHGTATSRTQSWPEFLDTSHSHERHREEVCALRSHCVVFQVVHKHKTIGRLTSKQWKRKCFKKVVMLKKIWKSPPFS